MPPPPGGFGTGQGGPPQQPSGGFEAPQFDPGSVLSWAWKKLTENFAPMAASVGVVVGVAALMWVFIMIVSLIVGASAIVAISNGGSTSIGYGALAVMAISWGIGYIVIMCSTFGVWRTATLATRGRVSDVSTVLSLQNLGSFLTSTAIVGAAILVLNLITSFLPYLFGSIVFLLFVIPIGFFTGFAPIIALETGASPMEAISRSMNLASSNMNRVAAPLGVTWLVVVAGVLLCCLGFIVTFPLGTLGVAYIYRGLNNEMVAS